MSEALRVVRKIQRQIAGEQGVAEVAGTETKDDPIAETHTFSDEQYNPDYPIPEGMEYGSSMDEYRTSK